MDKKCQKCKQEWPDYMWFCPKCGIVLKKSHEIDSDESEAGEQKEQLAVPGTEDLMEKW